jgi:formylglycine-generating enzyme required for sulfatase activity
MHHLSWHQARAFCEAIGARLPSEAEWEYAARAGTTTRYYCGNDDICLDSIAWYVSNADARPHEVAQKAPNAFGLYDMLGNILEWNEDWWHENYVGAPSTGGVWPGGDSSGRVLRGGFYASTIDSGFLRVSARFRSAPTSEFFGVRCAR